MSRCRIVDARVTGAFTSPSKRSGSRPAWTSSVSTFIEGSGDVELHALRERQLAAVVDRVGGAPHVRLPAVRARLTTAAGFLFAAEGAADLGARRADVDVGDSAVGAERRREQLGLAQVGREDRRRQALRHLVVQAD